MFRHHPDGYIFIDDEKFEFADFLTEEPAYKLPAGMIGREYDPAVPVDACYSAKGEKRVPGVNAELDGYIANKDIYKANITERFESKSDDTYATNLAAAKVVQKKRHKREMSDFYKNYRDEDFERSSTEIAAWKATLLSHKPTIAAEIDALTTIREVRNYKYQAWPLEPQ